MGFTQVVASAQPREVFWLSAILAALIAGTFIAAFVFVRRTRLLEDLPTSRVRSAAQGYVELEGVARLMEGEPVICPLTATRCAWWSFTVHERQGSGRNRRWVRIAGDTSSDCFLLDDGSGACIVDPSGATVIPTISRTWYGHRPSPDIGPEAGKGWWRQLWCDFRYTEQLIPAATRIYTVGQFRTQTGVTTPFDEEADLRDLLAKWKHDSKMMALFDVNKDGAIDAKEWEAARRAGREQVRREHVREALQTPDLNILGKPRDRRPFILSGISQAQLVLRFRTWAAASIGACTLFSGFALLAMRARGVIG